MNIQYTPNRRPGAKAISFDVNPSEFNATHIEALVRVACRHFANVQRTFEGTVTATELIAFVNRERIISPIDIHRAVHALSPEQRKALFQQLQAEQKKLSDAPAPMVNVK